MPETQHFNEKLNWNNVTSTHVCPCSLRNSRKGSYRNTDLQLSIVNSVKYSAFTAVYSR